MAQRHWGRKAPCPGRATHGRAIAWHADTGSCAPWHPFGSLIPDIGSVLGGFGTVSCDFGLWGPKKESCLIQSLNFFVQYVYIKGVLVAQRHWGRKEPRPGGTAHGMAIARHADTGSCAPWLPCGILIPDIGSELAALAWFLSLLACGA